MNLSEKNPLVMSFYQPLGQSAGQELHCKLYHADTPLALSDVLPILENLGLRVLGEFPYRLRHANGREFWIHDFAFIAAEGVNLDIQQLNDTLQDAFVHIVHGDAENDEAAVRARGLWGSPSVWNPICRCRWSRARARNTAG